MKYYVEVGNSNYKILSENSFIRKNEILNNDFIDNSDVFVTFVNKKRKDKLLNSIKNVNFHILKKETIFNNINFEFPTKGYSAIGSDRLLNIQGAIEEKFDNALIIDMGTAITYNLIENKKFLGGAISPSYKSRFEILSKNGELPKIELQTKPYFTFANNTENSIINGVFWGIIGELKYFIEKSNQKNIIFTGGNAHYILDFISKNNYYFFEDLIFTGMKSIINRNNK